MISDALATLIYFVCCALITTVIVKVADRDLTEHEHETKDK